MINLTSQFSNKNLNYYLSNLSVNWNEDAINYSYNVIDVRVVFLLLVNRLSIKINYDIIIITKDVLSL